MNIERAVRIFSVYRITMFKTPKGKHRKMCSKSWRRVLRSDGVVNVFLRNCKFLKTIWLYWSVNRRACLMEESLLPVQTDGGKPVSKMCTQ